jgi:molybdenum cofactor cytidylyltransferase
VIFAVVPAAGHSTRMGRPKLALPLGDRTILEHTVSGLRAGGVGPVVVVIGPHVPELVPLAERAGAEVCRLPEPTADMRTTVGHGLRWLEERHQPRPDDAWLLSPADHPALNAGVVRTLLDTFAHNPSHSILIPTHAGRRGHPALIAWRHVAGIRTLPADRGINAYFREYAGAVRELPVPNPGVLCDLDTPEDYARLREAWGPSGG